MRKGSYMHKRPTPVIEMTGKPREILEQFKRLVNVPDQASGEHDDDEGKDDRPIYLVQLVLDRPYKNEYEAHVLQHVLDDIDGVCSPVVAMAALVSNPLDQLQVNASGEWTFTVLTLRAANESEAEDLVREAVTDTTPAPFGIATLRLTQVASNRKDRG